MTQYTGLEDPAPSLGGPTRAGLLRIALASILLGIALLAMKLRQRT